MILVGVIVMTLYNEGGGDSQWSVRVGESCDCRHVINYGQLDSGCSSQSVGVRGYFSMMMVIVMVDGKVVMRVLIKMVVLMVIMIFVGVIVMTLYNEGGGDSQWSARVVECSDCRTGINHGQLDSGW